MIHATALHSAPLGREQEYLAGWQRDRAALHNMRKTEEARYAEARVHAHSQAIEPFLAIADNFRSLVVHAPEGKEEDAWVQGVLHISRQVDGVLESLGVQLINPRGQTFDPGEHEAIEQIEADEFTSGTVTDVLQVGYKMKNKVMRPAKVRVAK
ncbi:MAG: nucleotide exchange factor GrpE [Acidobacteriota bacterium]